MAWWGWALIWCGLLLGLLGMLVWFAIWLFQKAMITAGALAELGDRMALLSEAFEHEATSTDIRRFNPAIFQDAGQLAFERNQDRAERARRRQRRRDRRIDRGKLLVHPPTHAEDTAACFRT